MAEREEQWGTRFGVILAVAGSAVGLGNFLRFPGTAAANGGGAFMIPYFVALLLVGIPVGWAEWTMGRYGGRKGFHSCPAILGVVGRGKVARYFGVLGLLIPAVVYMYYGIVESWCLHYAWAFATGGIGLAGDASSMATQSSEYFASVSGIDADGRLDGQATTLLVWLAIIGLNAWFVWKGLTGGIEKFCQWAMPAMAVCAVIVLVRVLTLGTPDPTRPDLNVEAGLGFMWNPDFAKLANAETWLAAAGQIFFSLSVGFGVIVNYASYVKKKDDIVLSGLTASATNEVFEVGFGGLITLTAAFVFLGAAGATGGVFGLGFNTLPVVFAHMGPLGNVIGALWFFMLFLAAITSSLSMLQPVKAFLQEALGWTANRSVVAVVLFTAVGSLWNLHYTKDLVALDTMDFWVGTTAIFVLATVQVIYFGWVFGLERGMIEAHHGAKLRIPRLVGFVIKYVAPAYLLVVFVAFCFQTLDERLAALSDNPVAGWTVGIIGVVLVVLVVLVRIGEKRWRAAGLDLDGTRPPEEDTT